ncbi:MAG TPA: hypothetical protein VFQ40_08320 [Actinomycetota bacterium]|nr:hypothetical protein [Actinomycetota bacterium]
MGAGGLRIPRGPLDRGYGATRIVVATFGTLAALAGIEHGIGEILQGPGAPGGLMIRSWPDAEAMDVLQGEPALTVIPDLLLAGVLTVLVAAATAVWSVVSRGPRSTGIGLIVLGGALLVVGGGFGPPLVVFILGIAATRAGVTPRRALGHAGRAVARAWPWCTAAGAVGFLGLMPGTVVLSALGFESAGLTVGLTVLAFGGLVGALITARARDRSARWSSGRPGSPIDPSMPGPSAVGGAAGRSEAESRRTAVRRRGGTR